MFAPFPSHRPKWRCTLFIPFPSGVAHVQKNTAEQLRSVLRTCYFGQLFHDASAALELGLWPAAFIGHDTMSDKQAALMSLASISYMIGMDRSCLYVFVRFDSQSWCEIGQCWWTQQIHTDPMYLSDFIIFYMYLVLISDDFPIQWFWMVHVDQQKTKVFGSPRDLSILI